MSRLLADSKAAQMFTLAHELVHIWLGESGISDPSAGRLPEKQIERWCNRVAAELLLPLEELKNTHNRDASVPEEMQRMARLFKVSTLVVLPTPFFRLLISIWLPTHWQGGIQL